jgi:hypothetical protein
MESPDIHKLRLIDWQFFGTLTFKSERVPERVRLSAYLAMMREVAKQFRVFFPHLLWCLRLENGEATGRRHFHYLLAGLPRQAVTITTCFFQMSAWETAGGGMARVHRFDPRLNGAGYLLKCLGEQTDAGDSYESAKFGGCHCQLMLSNAAEEVIRLRSMRERDV